MESKIQTWGIQACDAYRLRLAANHDAALLWEWANDPVTRKNSFDPAAISWKAHAVWFAEKLASPDCRIWLLELAMIPVGQIRFECSGADTAQISFSVAQDYRGKRLGTLLLQATPSLAGRELGVSCAEGITFIENLASQRAFFKAGFTAVGPATIAGRDCMIFRRRGLLKDDGVRR
jgi:RimJ/RimL family protein N-acetyltransferase